MGTEDGEPAVPAMNHIGISVLDLDEALRWYQETLGFTLLTPPVEMSTDSPDLGQALADMLGRRVKRFRMAHLNTGNSVGLQVFEFIDPPAERPDDDTAFWRTGFFHICLTHPKIEAMADRIVEHGGTSSRVYREIPGKPYAAVYCADPWGNVIEINSHGYEETRTFLQGDK